MCIYKAGHTYAYSSSKESLFLVSLLPHSVDEQVLNFIDTDTGFRLNGLPCYFCATNRPSNFPHLGLRFSRLSRTPYGPYTYFPLILFSTAITRRRKTALIRCRSVSVCKCVSDVLLTTEVNMRHLTQLLERVTNL